MSEVKIGLVGLADTTFDLDEARKAFAGGLAWLRAAAQQLSFELVPVERLVLTLEEAAAAAKRFSEEAADLILVQSSTFAGGSLLVPFIESGLRLGLWAVPEPFADGPLPVNSFCGMNMFASVIKHYYGSEIKFRWFYGAAGDAAFSPGLENTLAALKAIKTIKGASIVQVGTFAPGFVDLYFDERSLKAKLGCSMTYVSVSEVVERAEAQQATAVAEKLDALTRQGTCADVTKLQMEHTARVCLALREIAEAHGSRALAVDCWPKFQTDYGIKVCTAVGRLNQEGYAVACEGDVPGAVSQLMLNALDSEPSTLMDLSRLDLIKESVMMWHCGATAPSWCPQGAKYSRVSIGPRGQKLEGTANDLVFAPGPVTIMRIIGESDGMFCFTGKIPPKQDSSYDGSRGWVHELKIRGHCISVLDLINTIMVNGIQHHYAMARGDHERALLEASYWLDLKMVEPVAHM